MLLPSVKCPKFLEGVYYIQSVIGLIKIGRSNDILRRFRRLDTQSCVPLRLVGWEQSDDPRTREAELHEQFIDLSIRYEWFSPGAELLMHIATINEQRTKIEDELLAWAKEPITPVPEEDGYHLFGPPARRKLREEKEKQHKLRLPNNPVVPYGLPGYQGKRKRRT